MTSDRRTMLHWKKTPVYFEEIVPKDIETLHGTREGSYYPELFLGRYTKEKVVELLTKAGIIDVINKKGYTDILFTIHRDDAFTSRLFVNFDRPAKETRLIELILKETSFRPKKIFVDGFDLESLTILMIEWLALQDPKRGFSQERPRLPGQVYPGLGVLRKIQDFLYKLASVSGKDAIMDIPEYYHSAFIYSHVYSFYSPSESGRLQAMVRDLDNFPLADVSYAVSFGCLLNENTGKYEQWKPSEQIYPISDKLIEYVNHSEYNKIKDKTESMLRYSLDWDKYHKLLRQGIMDEV